MNELQLKPNFSIKKNKTAFYIGQVDPETRQRHGLGVYIYKTGRVYEGEWEQDQREGRGFEIFPNGSKYLGNYEQNKAHGEGLYTWPNGEVYEG